MCRTIKHRFVCDIARLKKKSNKISFADKYLTTERANTIIYRSLNRILCRTLTGTQEWQGEMEWERNLTLENWTRKLRERIQLNKKMQSNTIYRTPCLRHRSCEKCSKSNRINNTVRRIPIQILLYVALMVFIVFVFHFLTPFEIDEWKKEGRFIKNLLALTGQIPNR